jgi:GGDEF domain-containing protein
MQAITRYLRSLQQSIDGEELRGLILRILRHHRAEQAPDLACLFDLYRQLQNYADDPLTLPSLRLRALLLQQHIAPYLTENEITLEPVTEAPSPAGITQLKDHEKVRQAWMKAFGELAEQRDALEYKLAKTTEQFTRLQIEHQRACDELAKAQRDARLPRALPAQRLIARRARRGSASGFAQRLEAETQRATRTETPLAVALIEIPLDALCRRHGAHIESALRRCYAEALVESFRAYDVVALVDNNRFAVLFPDTPREGAERAIDKAQKRVRAIKFTEANLRFALPPFVASLAMHAPNDEPSALLARAEQTLVHARRHAVSWRALG